MNNTNLVYMCCFCKKEYIDMLTLLLISMKQYSKIDTFDILIFTNKEFEEKINSLSIFLEIPLIIKVVDINTAIESVFFRLNIFDYEYIEKYTKILHIDTDILIQNDLTAIFNLQIEDKLYAVKEVTVESEYHGAELFDFSKVPKDTPAFNAGVLLFNNSKTIKNIFNIIKNDINIYKQNNMPYPKGLDQAFINYYFITKKLYDIDILTPYVNLVGKYNPIGPLNNICIMNHFYGYHNIHISKIQQMVYHLDYLFNDCLTNDNLSNTDN